MMFNNIREWMASLDDWNFQEYFAKIIELYGVMFAEMKRRDLFANPADPPTIKK